MDKAKKKAKKTYDLAADSFDHPANSYWDRYGRRTVERLGLKEGGCVLDVGCGAGASAIPAGELVGATGKVIGIDLADRLLALAREKAEAKGLSQVEFQSGDMTDLPFSEEFDAVVCVFGIFFVPDMESLVRGLWGTLKPGGTLAITTWGPRLFEPMYGVFDDAVRPGRPDLVTDFRPWDRLIEKDQVQSLLSVTNSSRIEVTTESGSQEIQGPDDWWKVVLGSGLRSVVEVLGTDASKVKEECGKYMEANAIRSIETNVIYGAAIK